MRYSRKRLAFPQAATVAGGRRTGRAGAGRRGEWPEPICVLGQPVEAATFDNSLSQTN